MAQSTLNTDILAYGFSGLVAPHADGGQSRQPATPTTRPARADDADFHQPVRSLMVRLLNPRA